MEAASGRIKRTTLDLSRSTVFNGDKYEFNIEKIKIKWVLISYTKWDIPLLYVLGEYIDRQKLEFTMEK